MAANTRRLARRYLVDGHLVAPLPPEQHGRPGTYTNHGCRCVRCRAAWTTYNARRRKAARA